MKVLVTGAKGQLGSDVLTELQRRGLTGIGVGKKEMDVTDAAQVLAVIQETKPDAVIHCAAFTDVDLAEEQADLCRQTNAEGTRHVAEACRQCGIPLMYISTAQVFSGEGMDAWRPDESRREPCNTYGRTKCEGEQVVEELLERYFIVRTSRLFGRNGDNYVRQMLELSKTQSALNAAADQIGSPTYTFDLARLLVDMIQTDQYGHYHATNSGLCTWHEMAEEIFLQKGIIMSVEPVTSEEIPTKARRPRNSRLDKAKLLEAGFDPLPPWQDALKRFLIELSTC